MSSQIHRVSSQRLPGCGRILGIAIRYGLAAVTCVAATSAGTAGAGNAPVVIPRDEAPHDVALEWWYYTGHLTGRDMFGRAHSYGFQVTYFREGLGTYPFASAYIGNMAVTDLDRGFHQNDTRISVQPDALLPGGGYAIPLFDWNIAGRNGSSEIAGGFATLDYALQLDFAATTPVILNGDQGVMPPNASGALDYYSFVNLRTSGTLIDHGLPIHVSGSGWFDHEYGTPSATPVGWHWYAIELSNGSKYNISVLKDADNVTTQTYGTYIAPTGSYSRIDPASLDDADLAPSWTSPRSGVTYPMAESVNVPGGQLVVRALVDDQEMTLLGPSLALFEPVAALGGVVNIAYWEGDSTVSGTVDGVPVSGTAYMELNPYQALSTP